MTQPGNNNRVVNLSFYRKFGVRSGLMDTRTVKSYALPVLLLAVLAGVVFWPAEKDPSLVLSEGAERPEVLLPEAPIAKRYRHVRLNPAAIDSVRKGDQVVELQLFPGETVRVVLDPSERTGDCSTEVQGTLEGVPGSMVSMVTLDDAVAATVQYPDGRMYMVNYAGGGEHSIVELDGNAMHTPHELQEHFEAQPVIQSPDGAVTMTPQLQFGVTNRVNGFPQFTHVLTRTNPWPTQVVLGPVNYGPPIMSIMVLYTPEAKKQCAGLLGIESRIRLCIAQVNAAFRRSLVTAKLVLAHTGEVNYNTAGNLFLDLRNVTFGLTPDLLEVHKLRQAHRADLVSLFVAASPDVFHGTSWMLNRMFPAPDYGFNVVEAVYAPTSVFAHEIGHNLGCNHATNDIGGYLNGAMTNSHGWRFTTTVNGNTYPMRTIMAYGAGPRLGYYSNPNVNIWGSPAGNAASAFNANTISNTAPMVGSYLTEIIHVQKLGPNAVADQTLLPGTTNRPGVRQPRRNIRLNFGPGRFTND